MGGGFPGPGKGRMGPFIFLQAPIYYLNFPAETGIYFNQ